MARLPDANRRRLRTPKGSRAPGSFRQAVLVLRWFRERGCVHCLARDAGVFQATGYPYLHEGIAAGEHTERSLILDLALALAEDRRRDIIRKTNNGLEAARRLCRRRWASRLALTRFNALACTW
ncbi:hypothetical protein [Actinomadura opuntiae]|uniref:hypothetical protein n=1 Tax=Actinomadura sp. OS1-43 TaxID=604315 RepID=UPI004062CFE5